MAKALKKNSIIEGEVLDQANDRLRVVDGGVPTGQDSLEKEFKLKSEFFEKNVQLPDVDKSKGNESVTQVKVFRDSGVNVIDPNELKSFVRENKDIKQVVVEKISIDEATRVSLLFEPKHHASEFISLVEDQVGPLSEQSRRAELLREETQDDDFDEKVFSLNELEDLINHEFISPNSSVVDTGVDKKSHKDSPSATVVEVVEEDDSSHLNFEFPKTEKASGENSAKKEESDKKKFSFGHKSQRGGESKPSFRLKGESLESKEESHFDSKANNGASDRMNLKLKSNEEGSEKKVNYEKHTFTRKKNKSGHGYYYRAKDHVELFKVGSSFLKDFRSGLKSFSFSSVGLKEEREKSVLGILSFFNYHEDVNICVVTPSLKESYYSRIATKAKKREAQVFDEDLHYEFYTGDGFEVIEYSEFKRIERKITTYNFEDFLDFILDSFDIVLWDLPDIEILDSNKEVFFPIVRSLENVSFIVGKNVSRISEINEMISYFKRYQIPIKGLLFCDSPSKDGKVRKEEDSEESKDRGGEK
jgi:hypothetical protein